MKLKLALILFLTGLTAYAGNITDSLSYAFGNQLTLMAFAGQTAELINNEKDCEEFIRGLEEDFPESKMQNDSSYIISYALGGMQGVFFYDGISHKPDDRKPPIDCIIQGLREVGSLNLRADTIEISRYLRQFPDSLDPVTLPEEERCRFFRAYGVMKGLQPGLQEYVESYKPDRGFKANQIAYAKGFADVLETSLSVPKNAYEMGKMIVRSLSFQTQGVPSLDKTDFLYGAKAALGLSDELMPREDCERIIMKYYSGKFDGAVEELTGEE